MDKIINIKDLLVEQIRELYRAEHMQLEVLSTMLEQFTEKALKKLVQDHKEATENQTKRLEDIFEKLQVASFGERSQIMQGLIEESDDLVRRSGGPEIRDSILIANLQYVKHFEIAGYGTACTYANELNLHDIADLLHHSMKEEKEMDEDLSEIAKEKVNKKANPSVSV